MRFGLTYPFLCVFFVFFKIHMEMLGVNLHEQRLHPISKQTMMYHRSDKEGKNLLNLLLITLAAHKGRFHIF